MRRLLVFVLLLWLTVFYLFVDFRGLSAPEGMDQAQIAREMARGNGFVTKKVSPLAVYQINHSRENEAEHASFERLKDTYTAPLNPVINSIALRFFKLKWEYDRDSPVYYLDRVIAVISALFFLMSIGVFYLLISKIFDMRIAGISVVLILLCELMWNFAQSGLPQMLMLFLFSCALFFLFKGVERAKAGESPVTWVALSGGFFALLALTNWLAIWVFLGAFLFVAIYFRPRWRAPAVLLGVFLVLTLPWGARNWVISGSPLGAAYYSVYNGLAGGTEGAVMRNFDPEKNPLPTDGLPTKLTLSSLRQLNGLYEFLGSVLVAPLFFVSLLHPFRRPEIAAFRWGILSMWIGGVVGMSVYGLTKGRMDPHQLHVLFIPLMTAYGLAFLVVLWTRLGIAERQPILRNLHFVIVIGLSALPLVLQTPGKVIKGIRYKGYPHWPPYVPAAITRLGDWTGENEVIVSDVPWAVAWYADRISLWLPADREQFDMLREYGAKRETPFAGIYLTPETIDRRLANQIMTGEYGAWSRLILRGEIFRLGIDVLEEDFPYRFAQPMPINNQSFFYSDRRRWLEEVGAR